MFRKQKNSSIMIRLTMKSMLAMLHVFCQHYYYFARSLLCKWGKRDFAAFFLPKNWCILYKEHQLPLTHSHFIAQSGITKVFAAYIIALYNLSFSICHFIFFSIYTQKFLPTVAWKFWIWGLVIPNNFFMFSIQDNRC